MVELRLLEVVSGFGLGGAERALLTRMKYLPPKFEQRILNVRPEIDVLEIDPQIKEYQVNNRGLSRLIKIYKFLSNNEFDLIIVRTPVDAIRFSFFQMLGANRPAKLILEAHSNFVTKRFGLNFFLQFFLWAASSRFDLTIAVSRNVMHGPMCRGQKNVQVINLGAELVGPVQLKSTPDTARLVFVGRLIELKRPVWLLERLIAVRSRRELPDGALTIVGSGPLGKKVEEFILTHNLQTTVRFVGEQKNVTPYLLAATHLVSPSTNEGLPLTFFEAKLAGLAILATPSGGGVEIFDANDRELKSFDEVEFEDALIEIFSTPPQSLVARKKTQADSSWMSAEQCAEHYYALLTQLFSKKLS
jgi:glycosyltransferase involved in cell wall biosynthesis